MSVLDFEKLIVGQEHTRFMIEFNVCVSIKKIDSDYFEE